MNTHGTLLFIAATCVALFTTEARAHETCPCTGEDWWLQSIPIADSAYTCLANETRVSLVLNGPIETSLSTAIATECAGVTSSANPGSLTTTVGQAAVCRSDIETFAASQGLECPGHGPIPAVECPCAAYPEWVAFDGVDQDDIWCQDHWGWTYQAQSMDWWAPYAYAGVVMPPFIPQCTVFTDWGYRQESWLTADEAQACWDDIDNLCNPPPPVECPCAAEPGWLVFNSSDEFIDCQWDGDSISLELTTGSGARSYSFGAVECGIYAGSQFISHPTSSEESAVCHAQIVEYVQQSPDIDDLCEAPPAECPCAADLYWLDDVGPAFGLTCVVDGTLTTISSGDVTGPHIVSTWNQSGSVCTSGLSTDVPITRVMGQAEAAACQAEVDAFVTSQSLVCNPPIECPCDAYPAWSDFPGDPNNTTCEAYGGTGMMTYTQTGPYWSIGYLDDSCLVQIVPGQPSMELLPTTPEENAVCRAQFDALVVAEQLDCSPPPECPCADSPDWGSTSAIYGTETCQDISQSPATGITLQADLISSNLLRMSAYQGAASYCHVEGDAATLSFTSITPEQAGVCRQELDAWVASRNISCQAP